MTAKSESGTRWIGIAVQKEKEKKKFGGGGGAGRRDGKKGEKLLPWFRGVLSGGSKAAAAAAGFSFPPLLTKKYFPSCHSSSSSFLKGMKPLWLRARDHKGGGSVRDNVSRPAGPQKNE